MDYNQNNQDNHIYQSYYQQPAPQSNPFAIASMVCGIFAIVLCCTGVFAIPLGALGILFAILSKRLDKPMSRFSTTGVILSIIGLLLGIIMCVYAVATTPTGENADSEGNTSFEEFYNDYFNEYYNDSDEDYDNFYDYGFEDL